MLVSRLQGPNGHKVQHFLKQNEAQREWQPEHIFLSADVEWLYKRKALQVKLSICSNNCQRQSFYLQFGSMCTKSSSMPETYSDFTIRLNKNHLFLMGWVTYSIADSNNSAHFVRLPPPPPPMNMQWGGGEEAWPGKASPSFPNIHK